MYFTRLETSPFFRLLLDYYLYSHLARISIIIGAGENALHWDTVDALEGLSYSGSDQKFSAASYSQLLLPLQSPMPSHVSSLYRTSVIWRSAKRHCKAAEFLLIIYFFKNKFKALKTIIK
jgi:hypothetical protein